MNTNYDRLKRMTVLIAAGLFWVALGYAKDVPLSEVPTMVIEAAKEAVPGVELQSAETEKEDGALVYELAECWSRGRGCVVGVW